MRRLVARSVLRVAGLVAVSLVLGTSLLPAAGPARAQSSAPTVDSVLARMARIEGFRCEFREEKRIALLSRPIVSEGTIVFLRGRSDATHRMVRRVRSPSPQVLLIDGGELRTSDGRTTQRIDLASQPVVRSFVDSFLQLLVGDRAALERTYALALEVGSDGGWALILRPRGAPLDRFLREIRFEGTGEQPTRMVMVEVSGDVTTTTFRDVDARRRYSPEEASRVFSLSLD